MRTRIILAGVALFFAACGSEKGAGGGDTSAPGDQLGDDSAVLDVQADEGATELPPIAGALVVETGEGTWVLRPAGEDAEASLHLQAEPFELRLVRDEAPEDARLVLPTFGFGTVPEKNEEEREKNRRVEFTILDQK